MGGIIKGILEIIVAFVIMITLSIFINNIVLEVGIIFVTVIIGYITMGYLRNKKD